jgi:ABC-type glutathione transport system ATPase component
MLTVRDLRIGAGDRPLVHGVSLSVGEGEVLGIVGESGSGKTMTAFALAGLLPVGVTVTGGSAKLRDLELFALVPAERRRIAGDRIGVVFQDPLSSFNPVHRVGAALIESAMRHQNLGRPAARDLAIRALAEVRLPEPELLADAYPHQLSGGQRQRVMIALAGINNPDLLIADEPTTALDATVQRSVLALLQRQAKGRATLLITHDLGVAASLCDHILVLREGAIVEQGPSAALLADPQADYTRALISARRQLSRSRA